MGTMIPGSKEGHRKRDSGLVFKTQYIPMHHEVKSPGVKLKGHMPELDIQPVG